MSFFWVFLISGLRMVFLGFRENHQSFFFTWFFLSFFFHEKHKFPSRRVTDLRPREVCFSEKEKKSRIFFTWFFFLPRKYKFASPGGTYFLSRESRKGKVSQFPFAWFLFLFHKRQIFASRKGTNLLLRGKEKNRDFFASMRSVNLHLVVAHACAFWKWEKVRKTVLSATVFFVIVFIETF